MGEVPDWPRYTFGYRMNWQLASGPYTCQNCGQKAVILYGSQWTCECGHINPLAETEDRT